jgi:glycosyltransferase involved in cell wall biosynthesis
MPLNSVTLIISVYKDVEALSLIIDSLAHQTLLPNEVIISEDGESITMKTFVEGLPSLPFSLIHLTQEDNGWQKNRALNRAITDASSDYLIFIDGDCIPYDTFIEGHATLQEKNHVLCGRRSEPGKYFSTLLRNQEMTLKEYVSHYISNFFALKRDHVKHYEEGIYLGKNNFIFKLLNRFSRKDSHLVGCNFSCFKSDMIRINGFDEDFKMPTTGEDSDIERRMRILGVKMKSCRNVANMVHLDHPKVFNSDISAKTMTLMQSKGDSPYCINGFDQHRQTSQSK